MIDSHCHLTDDKIIDNIDEIVDTFKANGVEMVLNIGVNKKTSLVAKEQAEKFDCVYSTVGFHPEDVDDYNEEEFEKLIRKCLNIENMNKCANMGTYNSKCIAVGEIGLDYYWRKDNKEEQIKCFESQIKLAKKYNLPFIVHNRDASGDVLEILKRNAPYNRTNIIHCFSASKEWAEEVIKLGFVISFSGSVTFNNAKNLQAVAIWIDDDKFLVETDSPYLTPVPYRGIINEPKYVVETAKFISNLRNTSLEHIDICTTNNFKRIFNIK